MIGLGVVDMAKRTSSGTHVGRRSWWNGDFLARCGLRVKKGRAVRKAGWWTMPTCPGCVDGIERRNRDRAKRKAARR